MKRVSCIIFTLNEEVNLPKCLKSLSWCDDIVVIDSGSTDATEAICRSFNVRFIQHPFTGFGDQRNWAMQNVTYKNEWLFILDADEEFTPELAEEVLVQVRNAPEDVAAFRVKRKFYLWGKWLKNSSLYPTWVVRLIKNGKVRYVNRGHAETQVIDGRELSLNADLKDENLKGLHAWFDRQNEYSTKESNYEANAYRAPLVNLFSSDALKRREAMKSLARRLPFRPLAFFIYNLIWKRGFLDGYVGFQFSLMKAIYVAMIDLKKYETQKYPHLYSENEVIDSNSKKQTSKTS